MMKQLSQREKTERKIRFRISRSARGKIKINKSNRYLYALFINEAGVVLSSLSTREKINRDKSNFSYKNMDSAKSLCSDIIALCKKKEWKDMAFDRSGYRYHGVVKAIGDNLREAGILL